MLFKNFFCIKRFLRLKPAFFLFAGILVGFIFESNIINFPKINEISNKSKIQRHFNLKNELVLKKTLLILLINDSKSNDVDNHLLDLSFDKQIFFNTEYEILEKLVNNYVKEYNLFFIVLKSTFFIHDQVNMKKKKFN